jgi:predicted permease
VPMPKGVQSLRAQFETPLLVLVGVVGLLLLMACVNLAALSVARTAARRHEIAVRLSLGATRLRLFRQFFTESLLVGLLGGAAGLVVSAWGTWVLIAIVTTSTQRLPLQFTMDGRLLGFTVAASLLAAALFGLFPALHASRTRIAEAFTVVRVRSRLPGSRMLIAAEMALSLFLLIGAGLFARSLVNLRSLDTGFAPENVVVFMLDPHVAYGQQMDKYLALYDELIARVESLPGVRSASLANNTFFGGGTTRGNITYEGQGAEAPRDEWPIKIVTTPHFAETLGLSLTAGRHFTDSDDRRAAQVAMVSESIARRYFPGANPIGKRFSFDSSFQGGNAIAIVGVVRDVRYSNLREASPYTLYLPLRQNPSRRFDLQVRTWTDAQAIILQVQEVIRQYDSGVRVVHAVTLDRLVEDSIAQDRLLALLAGCVATLALMLAAVGVFGSTSYGVNRRINEIGVRLALGASPQSIKLMVLLEVLVPGITGAAIGIGAALVASDAVRGLLFGLRPTDPLSIGVAGVVLAVVAFVAGFLPARRACRVDPIQALRYE